jgi:hypothetical protein
MDFGGEFMVIFPHLVVNVKLPVAHSLLPSISDNFTLKQAARKLGIGTHG